MPQEDDARGGLRERKKRETRVALSQATIRLCVENGWDNVTVDDIAAAANVSVRTFRNYFSSKAEAIAASHLERMLRIADGLRDRPDAEPLWDSLFQTALAQFAPGGAPGSAAGDTASAGSGVAARESARDLRWREGLRLMLAEPALFGEIVKANATAQVELARAIAERTGTDADRDVYPKLVAAVVSAGCGVAVEQSLAAESPTPLGPLLREVFDRLAAGLPVP